MRYALEAHRLLRGRFPTSLDELSRTGLLGEDALTQKEVAPYYYARRDGGVLLLAPER